MSKRTTKISRDKIVKFALKEFSARGYAGARVDKIAARAKVSKGMIYHHFKGKNELFAEVLKSVLDGGRLLEQAPDDPVQSIHFWNQFYQQNEDWSRILAWEGLEWRQRPILDEEERRKYWEKA